VLLSREISILPRKAVKALSCIPLFSLVCMTPGLSQKAPQDEGSLPKYDLHTETKTKGAIDEVNLLSVGTGKNLTELIIIIRAEMTRSTSTCARNHFKRRWASVSAKVIKLLLQVQR
jgi:hypothetical protein